MHWQLTDTTRRRAERTIRTIVNDGPNTSAPIETNLLMRTVTWYFIPVSDPQRLWSWGWMEPPSVREFARQSLEKDGAIDDYALRDLLVGEALCDEGETLAAVCVAHTSLTLLCNTRGGKPVETSVAPRDWEPWLGKRARKGKPAPGRSQANGLRGS